MKLKRKHIREEWDEGHPDMGGEGYWIALKSGWKWTGDPMGNCHTIHENTRNMAWKQGVMCCECVECKSDKSIGRK
jgi:hypothetical protein